METTQEERRKWIQWTLDNGDWRLKDLDTDFLRRVIRDANKADRLSAIERDVRELADEYQSEPISDELRAILNPPEES